MEADNNAFHPSSCHCLRCRRNRECLFGVVPPANLSADRSAFAEVRRGALSEAFEEGGWDRVTRLYRTSECRKTDAGSGSGLVFGVFVKRRFTA
jgi:hypothetical protein